jgi:pimeloyl-ACP methyl ester carboxylesterase
MKRPYFLPSLTVEQHINDCIKFSEWLMFASGLTGAAEGLYLVGGSWGSMLALLSLKRRPDLFKKCILRGLVTDTAESERQGMKFLKQRMQRFHYSAEEVSDVQALGRYPYGPDIDRLLAQREWVANLPRRDELPFDTLDISEPVPRWKLSHSFSLALFMAPEVCLSEIIGMKPAMVATLRGMWPDVETANMLEAVGGEVEVPLCVVHGQYDHCTAHELVLDFMRSLRAPSKHVVWFERSG